MTIETGTQLDIELPVWFVKKNDDVATSMRGEILQARDRAILFRGSILAKQTDACLRCGRELTHPVSLLVGIGPICCEKMGIDRQAYESLSPEDLATAIGERVVEVWIPRSVFRVVSEGLVMEMPAEIANAVIDEPTASAGPPDLDRLAAAFDRKSTAPPTPAEPTLADRVEQIFRKDFAAKMPGYEAREPQIQMARRVAEGFESGQHVIAEAGTGTGKSLAVMVPAIEHAVAEGTRVIISTGTIALQEQYVGKDVPMLHKLMDTPFRAELAKGKGNYLCKLRLEEELKRTGMFESDPILDWAQRTETGDLADYPAQPGSTWAEINVDDTCSGKKCPLYDQCHYFAAKRRLESAQLIIANHHLVMTDLAIKMQTGGFGGVLPAADAVVFDEAHHVESVARDMLGGHLTNYKAASWIRQVRRLPVLIDPADYHALQEANDAFFAAVAAAMEEDRADVPTVRPDLVDALKKAMGRVAGAVEMDAELFTEEAAKDRAGRLIEQAQTFLQVLGEATGDKADSNWVYWAEREQRGDRHKVTLHITPVDVADLLRAYLFDVYPSVVLTSATISVAGRFDYLRKRLGIDQALELQVDSPFNYRDNCLLYVPNPQSVPSPQVPDYHARIAPLIEQILLKTDGRAFVLFTSYRGMQTVYDQLADRLRYQVLRQGEAPRSVLLERFKQDGKSVLFGTRTFWEGIDVQGDALSCVIIDKLPFQPPNDPVAKAIESAVRRRGGKPFFEISVPEAVLAVKQGVGRLIRTKTDRGIVAILDTRIRTKSYGGAFLDSLPRARRIETLDNVEAFLAAGRDAA